MQMVEEVSHFDTEWYKNIVILLCCTFNIFLLVLRLKKTRISNAVQLIATDDMIGY